MADKPPLLSRRWPWLTAAALVVAVYLSTFVEIRLGGLDERPVGDAGDIERLAERSDVNVLFVLVDTLRAHRLSAYGYERPTSPLIDRIAESGVLFRRHLAQSSWTKCSMASFWTGLYPAHTGVTRFEHQVSSEARMPAEILEEAGFRTAGLYRNGWVEAYFGFDQGFDFYTKPSSKGLPPRVQLENPTLKQVGTDEDAVIAGEEFLRIYGQERWFLYLHLMDLHEYLYDEDTARFGTSYSDVYDNAILRENLVLDELFTYLAKQGLLEKTLVVIASDHGEAFGERGLEGHARAVYRETTEVPLVLAFPFRLEPGVAIETRTRNVDVWPTVLDLLGLPPMEHVDGRSRRAEILAAARGTPLPEDGEPGYAHLDQTWGRRAQEKAPTVAVVENDYRYVAEMDARGVRREQLFSRSGDEAEQHDRLHDEPEVAGRLRDLAQRYLEQTPPWQEATPSLEIDEIQLNQLRALGYQIP